MKLSIVSWNVEGVVPDTHFGEVSLSLGDPDVFCLQEICIRASDEVRVAAMASALPGYHAHYSLNRDAQNVLVRGGRSYGVVTCWKESLGARASGGAGLGSRRAYRLHPLRRMHGGQRLRSKWNEQALFRP